VSAAVLGAINAFSQLVVGFPQLMVLASESVTIFSLLFASFFELGVKSIVLGFNRLNAVLKLL
jgi:hypothetical protein